LNIGISSRKGLGKDFYRIRISNLLELDISVVQERPQGLTLFR
jgi:hypothetical protein